MSLTILNWVAIGLIALVGAFFSTMMLVSSKKTGIISFISTAVICIILIFVFNWWNTSTASGIRSYKDFKSNMDNGIQREITITAEDGREIFHYKGKVDVEFDNAGNYLRFETPEGERYCIDYGVQDTVKIIEDK